MSLIPKKYEKILCIKLALNGIKETITNIYKLLIDIINIINVKINTLVMKKLEI